MNVSAVSTVTSTSGRVKYGGKRCPWRLLAGAHRCITRYSAKSFEKAVVPSHPNKDVSHSGIDAADSEEVSPVRICGDGKPRHHNLFVMRHNKWTIHRLVFMYVTVRVFWSSLHC